MLGKCANPACETQFLSMGKGKLFHVRAGRGDQQAWPAVEHFWLCEECAREFTVTAAGPGEPVAARVSQVGRPGAPVKPAA